MHTKMLTKKFIVFGLLLTGLILLGNGCPGLNFQALLELEAAG